MKIKHLLKGNVYTPLSILLIFVFLCLWVFSFHSYCLSWQQPKTHCQELCPCSEPDMAPSKWQIRPHFPFTWKSGRDAETIGAIKTKYKWGWEMHVLKDLKHKSCDIIWIYDPNLATCLLLQDKGRMGCCLAQLFWMLVIFTHMMDESRFTSLER